MIVLYLVNQADSEREASLTGSGLPSPSDAGGVSLLRSGGLILREPVDGQWRRGKVCYRLLYGKSCRSALGPKAAATAVRLESVTR